MLWNHFSYNIYLQFYFSFEFHLQHIPDDSRCIAVQHSKRYLIEHLFYLDIHMDYLGNDVQQMIENIMTLQEHTFVFGTQMPFWNYTLPEGIALKVNSDYGLDINPHYFNYTDETIQGEVYLNFHTMLPQDVEKEAGILQLNNNNIELPPNQETTLTKTFSANQILDSVNINPEPGENQLNIFQLFSHAHQLMTEFNIFILH